MIWLGLRSRPCALQAYTHLARRNYMLFRDTIPKVYGHRCDTGVRLSLSADPDGLDFGRLGEAPENFKPNFANPFDERILRLFEPNRQFITVLHSTIKNHIHNCPMFSALAAAEAKDSAFFHIYDLRNPPVYGRIPEVEDIIGTVRLDGKGIVPQSYEANKMYRLATRAGYIQLSDYISEQLAKQLKHTNPT
uniref:ARAD1C29018p n=1 Tax=Blastobotrys adeninivorans TaxID=409370 RepID=A0A060T301_BLAAD